MKRSIILAVLAVLFGMAAALMTFRMERAAGRAENASTKPLAHQLISAATMLTAKDIQRSRAFYHDKLGFSVRREQPDLVLLQREGMLLYLVPLSPPTADKPGITLAPPDSADQTSVNLVLRVKDCAKAYDELRALGVDFLTPPQRPPWGGWRCFTRDPDGYLIEIEEEPGSADGTSLFLL